MCGIAGFIGPAAANPSQQKRRSRVVTALLMANVSRGSDASGVAFICPEGPEIVKGTGSAYGLVRRPEYAAGWHPGVSTVIGHTRLATHGANNDANAHPFFERTVTGVHNGVITNYSRFDKETKKGWPTPAEVDSQVVFRLLARAKRDKDGFLNSYAAELERLNGSMTLVWTDQRDPGATYVFRHDNPLNMMLVDAAKGAFISSEHTPLVAAIQSAYGDRWNDYTIVEDTLYRFDWDDKQGIMFESIKVKMPLSFSAYSSESKWGGHLDVYGRWIDDDDDAVEIIEADCTICGAEVTALDDGVERMRDGSVTCKPCTDWWRKEFPGESLNGEAVESKILQLPMATGEAVNQSIEKERNREIAFQFAKAMGLTPAESEQFVKDIESGKEELSPGEMMYLMDDKPRVGAERKN